MSSSFIHLFHIIFVGGLFLYIGIMRTNIPTFMYPILQTLGVVIILYHIYKAYKYLSLDKNPWVNYMHIFLIGPLLLYIGTMKEKTSRMYFEILLMFGMASIGYHTYYMIV